LGANWPREWGAYEIIDRNYSLKFENEADGLKSRLLVSSETGSNTVNNPPYMGNTYSTFENYGARFSEEGKAGDVLGFKAGFDWQNYGGRVGNYYADPSMDMTAGRYENDYAPYVMISGGTSALEINAGARYAINDKWGDEFLPQVGFKYKYSSDGDIYLNYSKGYRTPALGDAIMTVSPQDFAKFKPENFMQYEAGIEHSVEKLFACKLTVYQMEGTNILRPDPAFPYSPFAFLDTGNMLIKGAEADLHSDISKTFTFGTSMSYADPREKTAHFAYFTGKVYAKLALDKLTLDADMDFAKDRFDADNNGASLADYAILNGEASYTTDLGGINTTIYVSAQNFLDKEYYVENAYTAPGIFIKSGLFIKL
jgi:outer membrane cobalamin receptor